MNKSFSIFGTLLLLLLASSLVIAQTGGGFDLTWSTVDGGGGSSSGGDFALSGTIGQPDAGALAGGDFALSGGFWQCVATAELTSPGIVAVGNDVQLSWTGPAATIYRASNDPYFTPGSAYAPAVSSIWSDAGAVGVPATNYTYLIRVIGDCGDSAESQHLGEFDFAIVPGS